MVKPKVPDMRSPYSQKAIANATFAIGAEAANVITVSVQLKNDQGADLAVRGNVRWYISADANGDVVATAASGGIVNGTDGEVIAWTAGQSGWATSEADGDIDFAITDTGTPTMYLVIILPDGTLKVSTAIVFA